MVISAAPRRTRPAPTIPPYHFFTLLLSDIAAPAQDKDSYDFKSSEIFFD
jgi:hypothetical protein